MGVTAFSYNQMQYLKAAVKELAIRMQVTLEHPTIRPHQAVNLLARPEHRDMLNKVGKIAAVHTYYSPPAVELMWPTEPPVKITFCCSDASCSYLPKKPALQKDADPEIVALVTQWVTHTVNVARDFGRVCFVLDRLNELCGTKVQFRYLFPSIVPLCRMNEEMTKVAEAIGPFRVPKNLPPVPIGLRDAARLAAATITSAMLLEPATGEKQKTVQIGIEHPKWEEACGKFDSIS